MDEIKFETISRKHGSMTVNIHAVEPHTGYGMTVYLDKDTGNVLYPVRVKGQGMVDVTLDSDTMSSCSFPPSIPGCMVEGTMSCLSMFHGMVDAAREFIRKEQDVFLHGEMGGKRCMELLQSVVDHVTDLYNTEGALRKLLLLGFKPDELTGKFGFGKEEVDAAVTAYYDD